MSVQSSVLAAAPLPDNGRRTVRVTGIPSPRCCHTGGAPGIAVADYTHVHPVITEEYIAEVYVPMPTVINGIAVLNGDDVTGNRQLSIRDAYGNILALTASTAGSGTSVYQCIPIATTYQNNNGTVITGSGPLRVEAGTYFVTIQYSSATAYMFPHTLGSFGAGKLTSQTYGTFVAAAMPVTFTTALGPVASLY